MSPDFSWWQILNIRDSHKISHLSIKALDFLLFIVKVGKNRVFNCCHNQLEFDRLSGVVESVARVA